MATSSTTTTTLQSCVKCPKGQAEVMCGGCGQWFCLKHLLQHREELSRQMDELIVEHDRLQHDLIGGDNEQQHPLLTRVDQWESDAIHRIKQVANEVRDQLKDLLGQSKRRLEEWLRPISTELQEKRQVENYTEIDLTRWMSQLREVKRQLEKQTTIEIKNDQVQVSLTDIPLIAVSTRQNRGK